MAAAAVSVSSPFAMSSHQRLAASPPAASSSRSKHPAPLSHSPNQESTIKPFNRIRSSLEQSLRNATRSKKSPAPVVDEFATVSAKSKGKEKEKQNEKVYEEKQGMLRRLESKVNFRRITPSPQPPAAISPSSKEDKVRLAGSTSYTTPSLRMASMSSPALHLSSQASPSQKSQPVAPTSTNNSSTTASPREREKLRQSDTPTTPTSRHRPSRSAPINIPTSSSVSSLHSPPETPRRPHREQFSPPDTPTPMHRSRGSNKASSSTSHLPLSGSSSPSLTRPGEISAHRARSPSISRNRVVTPSHRGLTSSSTSHLPSSPSPPPTPTPSRPIDARRPSMDSPRRASFGREGSESPSSALRPRPISPNQRAYANNRHFNISTTSLSGPPNPEHRELIRTATAMLCKETTRPPPHAIQTESGRRDWEGVEVRMRALVRLERIWGKSGMPASSSNVNVNGLSSSGLSASGEERERRLFAEALRDGFVLCHLLNKLRSSSVVRPDPKEDGFVRTSNITKFLAACASYGLPKEDLFEGDDLIEATSETLARVAKTVIALIKFVDAPISISDRSKILSGQGRRPSMHSTTGTSSADQGASSSNISGPYNLGTAASRSAASASTPNLLSNNVSRATSPTQNATGISPPRKRWSPPNLLPTVRSESSEEGTVSKGKSQVKSGTSGLASVSVTQDVKSPKTDTDRPVFPSVDNDRDGKDLPLTPPPRSPLRIRTSRKSSPQQPSDDGKSLLTRSMNTSTASPSSPSRISTVESTRASIGDASIRDSIATTDYSPYIRQSVASSAMTDSTTTTVLSSLLEVGRSSSAGFSKFGTIRTMTTEATSETPSITKTEGNFIAEELARKHRAAPDVFDRKQSDGPVVDLTRVEEADESGSSSAKGGGRDKGKQKLVEAEGKIERGRERAIEKGPGPAIRLGKGKWPDDFMDAMQNHTTNNLSISASPTSDPAERLRTPTPLSGSPPRKLAVVGLGASRRNESVESLPQFPRRPSHRARHSIDTAGVQPTESLLRRDTSPDGVPTRVLPRRHSTKPRTHLLSKGSTNDDNDSPVPFPRSFSGDHTNSPSPYSSEDASGSQQRLDKPYPPRGRFQSDIEGSNRRRPRPNSYDELGAKPARSRFESMVNLGGASGNTSASDLMSRDSIDGSAVRKPLIIKEEGKVPTHFQLGNCIGRGQFGSVYRALNLNTGQMVAVKRIRLEGLKEEEVTQLMREVDLVKRLSHPSIIKYEGMHRDSDTLSIVLEYAENGSLGQTVKAFGKLNEKLVASYVVRILEGLHYLHQSDVVHCDLKAANILTTKTGNVKLSDFGVSLNMRAVEREQDVAGTPNWMAPEVIELKGASPKSDIWSLACTVIELLTGRPPYGDIPNSMSVMFRIVEDDMPPIPPGVSPLLEDFLKQCFHKDPTQRPSAELLCEHEWLKQSWDGYKQIRPQDSIPFLRRVSADFQKSEVVRYLSQIEMPDSTSEHPRSDDNISGSPPGRRMSNASMRPSVDEISPRDHSFVKTTFSKPMVCRVCLFHVKKNAVLCAQCSLICHVKCQTLAPPTCDLRAQLLRYAHYAEKGNPSSAYSNPADALGDAQPKSPMSDVAFVSHTPRTSLDTAPPPVPSPTPTSAVHPPVAFKFMNFKKPKAVHHPATEPANLSSSTSLENMIRKPTVLRKAHDDRAPSVKSSSTQANSSMRSAGTVASAGGNSEGVAEPDARASRVTSRSGASDDIRMPGELSDASRRHQKNKSSNCIVQ